MDQNPVLYYNSEGFIINYISSITHDNIIFEDLPSNTTYTIDIPNMITNITNDNLPSIMQHYITTI